MTMARTEKPYQVQRAIFIDGQHVEVGSVLHLTRPEAIRLMATGKVAPAPDQASKVNKNRSAVPSKPAANQT